MSATSLVIKNDRNWLTFTH